MFDSDAVFFTSYALVTAAALALLVFGVIWASK